MQHNRVTSEVGAGANPKFVQSSDLLQYLEGFYRYVEAGEDRGAAEFVHECETYATQDGWGDVLSKVHIFKALLCMRKSEPVAAMAAAVKAVEYAEKVGNEYLAAKSQLEIVRVFSLTGQHAEGIRELSTLYPVLERVGSPRERFLAEAMFASMLLNTEQYEEAIPWHVRAEETSKPLGLTGNVINVMYNHAWSWLALGDKRRDEGDIGGAEEAWRAGHKCCEALLEVAEYDLEYTPIIYALFGSALDRYDDAKAARKWFAKAESMIALDIYAGSGVAVESAKFWMKRQEYDKAAQQCKWGLENVRTVSKGGPHPDKIGLLELSSLVEERLGNYEGALAHLRESLVWKKRTQEEEAKVQGRALSARWRMHQVSSELDGLRQITEELHATNLDLASEANELRIQANYDPMTQLPNRRLLDTFMGEVHDHAKDTGNALYVAMLDVDHFKSINDTYSHTTGDEVLKALANLLRRNCRKGDIAGRYGGEEFTLVFPGASRGEAIEICERLRLEVEQYTWSSLAEGLAVTVSLGLAEVSSTDDVTSCYSEADTLLYKSKTSGRNRVTYS